MRYETAVIGGGPGGLATAMFAGMRGLSVIDFEAQSLGGQLIHLYPSKPVTNFPTQPEMASRDLAHALSEQALHFGAELATDETVEFAGRAGSDFRLVTAQREVTARTLVLALGLGRFAPRKLGLPKEAWFEGRGLVYSLPPRDEIKARRVVIVGGGNSAVDTALSLSEIADVTLVHRSETWRAISSSVEQLANGNVKVITNGTVIDLGGDERLDSVVVSIANKESVRLPADLLLVSIGQLPDLSGIENWNLGISGSHIAVNSAMETGTPGLYAVGDFASYPGKVKTITTAVAEGLTAANSAQMYLSDGAHDQHQKASG